MSTAPIELSGTAPSGDFYIHAAALTDVGRDREVNEDSLFMDEELALYIVCDGMGGHTNGQLASQMAIDTIVQVTKSQDAIASNTEQLVLGIEQANHAIYKHATDNEDCRGMGTTAIGVRLSGSRMHVCHVGDSRLYRMRESRLQRLTRDHSLSNLYADKPELEGRLGPATSNVIVRAVGLEPEVAVDHRDVAVEEEDLFLLCCDGLSDLVTDHDIQGMLDSDAPLASVTSSLVDAANRNGGTDNITVILISIRSGDSGSQSEGMTTLGF